LPSTGRDNGKFLVAIVAALALLMKRSSPESEAHETICD
jgi:hypothetical protein